MSEQINVVIPETVDSFSPSLDGDIPLTDNALTVLRKRYLQRGPDGEPVETPSQMFWRVANVVAAPDAEYGEDVRPRRASPRIA